MSLSPQDVRIRDPRILELHRQAPLIDMHCHPPLKLFLFEQKRFHEPQSATDADNPFEFCTDAPSLLQGGVQVALATTHVPEKRILSDCRIVNAVLPFSPRATEAFRGQPDEVTVAMLNNFEREVAAAQQQGLAVALCRDLAEMRDAVSRGNVALLHAIEGGHSLLGKRQPLDNLQQYYDRGVCLLTLAHFYDHGISPPVPSVQDDTVLARGGCFRKQRASDPDVPLHKLGEDVVRFMLEQGMIIDLTHSTPRARRDVYGIWNDVPREHRRPLVFSHAGVKATAPRHLMNPDWEEVEFIRSTGGVIGVIFMNYWLAGKTLHGADDSMRYVVQTIDALYERGFADCIALGSDFDGFTDPPRELKEPSDFPNLTDELITRRRYPGRRYTPEQVKAFIGGNSMRVLESGWGRRGTAPGFETMDRGLEVRVTPTNREALDELLAELGAAISASRSGFESAAEAPAFDADAVRQMRRELAADPTFFDDAPPHILGSDPSPIELDRLLEHVEAELRQPESALESLAEARAQDEPPYEFPEACRFEGHTNDISIRLSRRDMEDGDVTNWGITWAASKWYRLRFAKPKLPVSNSNFRYPLRTSNGRSTIGLFSDWGTGYYHSLYIARHLADLRPMQVVHLGDTYYTGSPSEIDKYLDAPLQQIVDQCPLYVMNANHEMMHNGIPFFDYIRRKQALPNQPQESTQFCLFNDHYQIIGIDTAYHKSGRHSDAAARAWLLEQLQEGRRSRKTNILLSQNEPYAKGKVNDLLKSDLQEAVLQQQLVDVWFWGDEHWCALYGPGPGAPFVGSCIGHGGYPYPTRKKDEVAPPEGVATLVWWEQAARFPKHLKGTRSDVGNNGFCMLELAPGEITIKYIDWRKQLRYHTRLSVQDGWVMLPETPVFEGPVDGSCLGHP